VPSFFVDPKTFGEFADVMDGDFNVSSISFFQEDVGHLRCLVELWMAHPSYNRICPKPAPRPRTAGTTTVKQTQLEPP